MKKVSDLFIIQGHRGVRRLDNSGAEENTPAAFAEAFKAGAEIELDLQMTADRQFIVFHDPVLRKKTFSTLTQDTPVYRLQMTDIEQLNKTSGALKLLTIDQVVSALLKTFDTHYKIDFELKYEGELQKGMNTETFTQTAIQKIASLWPNSSTRVRSFSPEVVHSIKKQFPKVETAMLTWTGSFDYLSLLQQTGAEVLAPHLNFISLEDVAKVRQQGFKVIPYAVQGHGDLDITENSTLYRHLFEHFDGWTSDSPKLVFQEAARLGVEVKKY